MQIYLLIVLCNIINSCTISPTLLKNNNSCYSSYYNNVGTLLVHCFYSCGKKMGSGMTISPKPPKVIPLASTDLNLLFQQIHIYASSFLLSNITVLLTFDFLPHEVLHYFFLTHKDFGATFNSFSIIVIFFFLIN